MNLDDHLKSIGTIFDLRTKYELATINAELALTHAVRCGKDSFVKFGRWFSEHAWQMSNLIETITEQLETDPNLRHGKIIQRDWNQVFIWSITANQSDGITLHLDFHGKVYAGRFEKLSWWWLARAA